VYKSFLKHLCLISGGYGIYWKCRLKTGSKFAVTLIEAKNSIRVSVVDCQWSVVK